MSTIEQDLKLWHHCGAKKLFKTESQAKDKALKTGKFYYRCSECSNYHLTSKAKKSQRQEFKALTALNKALAPLEEQPE